MKRKQIEIAALALLVLVAGGCALFTSHFDAMRQQNFTNLQALHEKFIEDYTEGSGKEWSEETVKRVCDTGDLRFREALTYAAAKDDKAKTGERAVRNLYDQFTADCKFALKRNKLFGTAWSGEHLKELRLNYRYAVSGELSRVGAPQ